MKIRAKILFAFLFCFSVSSFAKSEQIDSLKRVLSATRNDTTKTDILLALSRNFFNSSPDEAIAYATQAKEIAEKINYSKGIGYAYKNIGIGYYWHGDYINAIQNYQYALVVFDSINDKVGAANINSNLGAIYFNQSDDEKALEYYLKSLKVSEEVNDTFRIITACINIGVVYANKAKTYDKALEYYKRALPLSQTLNDKESIGMVAVNIGEVYFKKNEDTLALRYFEQSLRAFENSENAPYSLNYIGKVYLKRKDYVSATKYHQQAYEFAQKSDAKLDMAQSLLGLAETNRSSGNVRLSITYYKQAEEIAKKLSANYELKDVYEGQALAYALLSDYNNAFKYQTLLIGIKDTLYNIDSDKKLQGLQFTFDMETKQSQINLLTKDNELQEEIIGRQKFVRNSFIGGFSILLISTIVFFRQRNRIKKEKHRSEQLLLNILPEETAEELKETGTAKTRSYESVSVLFTDFRNFTQASEKLTPTELVYEINLCYSEFDRIITKHNIEKIKTIGDSYMCAGGLPVTNATHAEDAVKAGLEMQEFMEQHKQKRIAKGQPYFELRLGIHTGHVVAGIVGIKKFAYDIWGDTVNTASRMESSGAVGKVNISESTYLLVKNKFTCVHRGKVHAKNKGEIDMYFVESTI